jgi:hypothetical protein
MKDHTLDCHNTVADNAMQYFGLKSETRKIVKIITNRYYTLTFANMEKLGYHHIKNH